MATVKAADIQVGGNHYKKFRIQPAEFCIVNNLNGGLYNVLKYVMREKENRLEDLAKAGHVLQLLMQFKHSIVHDFEMVIPVKTFIYMNELTGNVAEIITEACRGRYQEALSLVQLEAKKEANTGDVNEEHF